MSITLTNLMFSKLSPEAQKEILDCFQDLSLLNNDIDTTPVSIEIRDDYLPQWEPAPSRTVVSSAFESASLSFSQPLKLPLNQGSFELKKSIRYAAKVPVALFSDIYSLKREDEIEKIISDIDLGYFIGPSSWVRGQKHHPENFDVRRVLQVIRSGGSVNSYAINLALPTVCRTRITSIMRELKIQGIVKVTPAI